VFERFDERARQVVVLAQDESRALRHNYIGTEHLLLGLLRDQDGVAARVLDSLDITAEEVRAEIRRIVGEGDDVTTGQIPFTPRAKKVLELSLREASSRGDDYIGTEHILLGIAAENDGVAARILLDFDVDGEAIRREVLHSRIGKGRSERTGSEPGEPIRGVSSSEILATSHVSRGVSYGGRAPWWQPVAIRAHLWFGILLGALLFGAGLLVGRLIWG